MITAILVLQCLALLALSALLLRKRIVVHPSSDWSAISENFTLEYWNNIVAIENSLYQQPLFQLSDQEAADPSILSDAFSKTAEAYYLQSKVLASLNPYGTDPRLHTFSVQSSLWISRRAANYQEWAQAIVSDISAPQEEAWLSVAKGAIKGAISGYLGGMDAVFGMFSGDNDSEPVSEMNLEIARLQHDAIVLEAERMTLNAAREGIGKLLSTQFNWTFEGAK